MGHFCYPDSYFDAEASLRVAVVAARDASHSGVVKTLSPVVLPYRRNSLRADDRDLGKIFTSRGLRLS